MSNTEHAEALRENFVNHEGKMKLEVMTNDTLATVNWNNILDQISNLIEKNTKGDTRQWLEPDFSTTTPVCRTVGQVVMMGVVKHYFDHLTRCLCGLPKVGFYSPFSSIE